MFRCESLQREIIDFNWLLHARPTNWLATAPFSKTLRLGIESILYSAARFGHSSTLTLTILASEVSMANSVSTGPRLRHGPHQSA